MRLKSLIQRHHIAAVLNSTGVKWRFGGSICHWNVMTANNLKPWTPEELSKLLAAVHAIGCLTKDKIVKPDFTTYTADPLKGFRVYRPGNSEVNEDAYLLLTGRLPD